MAGTASQPKKTLVRAGGQQIKMAWSEDPGGGWKRMDICEGRGRLHQLIYSINICRESTKGQALSRVWGI